MRVLVFGANGRLGAAVRTEFGATHDVTAFPRAAVDVTDPHAIAEAIRSARPEVVLNCAAYNDVDGAESQPLLALTVNGTALRSLASACEAHDAILVHYSSDFVFDGRGDVPYCETDEPNPLSVYGISKLVGEDYALRYRKSYVLRLESLFDAPFQTSQATFCRLLTGLCQGEMTTVYADRIATPSYAPDVAWATRIMLERSTPFGLYHCVNSGVTNWHELLSAAAEALSCETLPSPASARNAASAGARRPVFCAMSNEKLSSAGIVMPHWRDAVTRILAASASVPAPADS